eukprot:1018578-Pleurochrysis_carterae.AAC.2
MGHREAARQWRGPPVAVPRKHTQHDARFAKQLAGPRQCLHVAHDSDDARTHPYSRIERAHLPNHIFGLPVED